MRFSYRLIGTGWGEARVVGDSGEVALPTSYLADVLGDLLEAVGTLLDGAEQAECSWPLEPGEHRWLFRRRGGDVEVCILAFQDSVPRLPVADGTEVFRHVDKMSEVAAAIADGVAAVREEYGDDEYKRRWVEHPFPSELLATVQQRLSK